MNRGDAEQVVNEAVALAMACTVLVFCSFRIVF